MRLSGAFADSAKIAADMQATRTFAHAMLREIYEQPEALAATMARYAPGGVLDTNVFAPVAEAFAKAEGLEGHGRSVAIRAEKGRAESEKAARR